MSEYGKIFATVYDPIVYPFLTHIRKRVVKKIKQLNAKKIIDLCCGTGNQLKHLKKAGFENITGVDLSPFMIQKAKKGKYPVNCIKADAQNTPFKDDFFDVVIISFALHEMLWNTAKNIIKEGFRIIRPGGYFIAIDYCISDNPKLLGRIGSNFIERLAGKEHYSNYLYFISHGGMMTLFKNYKHISKDIFLFRNVAINIYQKNLENKK